METTWPKICHRILRPLKQFNAKLVCFLGQPLLEFSGGGKHLKVTWHKSIGYRILAKIFGHKNNMGKWVNLA